MNLRSLVTTPLVLTSAFFALAPAAFAQQLTPVRAQDGSATMSLAPGWRLTNSGNGAMLAAGPNGGSIMMGLLIPVTAKGRPAPPSMPAVDTSDPVRAHIDFVKASSARTGLRILSINAVEYLPGQNGRAAFVQSDISIQGKTFRVFGLYILVPSSGSLGWRLSSSEIGAPAEIFDQQYATMMAMWNSWSFKGFAPPPATTTADLMFDRERVRRQVQQNNARSDAMHAQARKFIDYIRE